MDSKNEFRKISSTFWKVWQNIEQNKKAFSQNWCFCFWGKTGFLRNFWKFYPNQELFSANTKKTQFRSFPTQKALCNFLQCRKSQEKRLNTCGKSIELLFTNLFAHCPVIWKILQRKLFSTSVIYLELGFLFGSFFWAISLVLPAGTHQAHANHTSITSNTSSNTSSNTHQTHNHQTHL